ncbi:MAG: TolC family protein [Bacteroidetes bacterium]|nr:MAG: TolC family protein [Bacteroidota bacterium]
MTPKSTFTRLTAALLLALPLCAVAQEAWDLRRCVDYALENNINIQQNKVQERLNALIYNQSKDGRWPSANFQGSGGEQFGRNVDPTTNLFTNTNIAFMSLGVQSGVTLFNFFSIKNTIEANRLNTEASRLQTERLRNDVSLNVSASYLQALLSYEQTRITMVQVQQTRQQFEFTRKRVDAGALPELNAAELEAQLARDTATALSAEAQYQLNLLSLKALLNLDAATPFAIATPNASAIPVEPLASLHPDEVYAKAVLDQPLQKLNDLNFRSAKKTTAAARASMYPTLGAFANLNTNYSSAQRLYTTGTPTVTTRATTFFVPVNNVNLPVFAPGFTYPGTEKANPVRQFDRNFRQSLGLTLNVPIFNGNQARTNWQRAKLNESTIALQSKADSQTLKQNIYQAYQNAVNALQTANARQKTLDLAQRSFDLGTKRYEVGLLPTLDLITLQNNVQRAKIDFASAQYEYVFRLKVLEFYKFNTIKL